MPTTGAVLATLGNVLKRHYLSGVREQLNNQILVTQLFDISSENLEGLQAELALHTARSGGIGSRGELGDLPLPGAQGYGKAVYDLAYHYGRIQVSGQAIHKTRSDVGSFLRAMKAELDMIKDDLALDFARQVYGNGDAIVAVCGASGPSATVTLPSNESLVRGFIYQGMLVDIGTTTNPTAIASGVEVTDVDVEAGTFTTGTSVTTTTSHRVYRTGNAYVTGAPTVYVNQEMTAGLQRIISTAPNIVGGLDGSAAGNKYWQNISDTSGGAISLSKLMINLNKSLSRGVTLENLVVTATPGLLRLLFESADFAAKIQFVNTEEMKGGFETISFSTGAGRVRLNADRLHPRGNVLFAPKKHIKLFSPADWDFLAKDGQTVKWVSNKDAFQSILFRYANMGTDRRNNAVRMSGLTDTDF